jgi:hypothetical protein
VRGCAARIDLEPFVEHPFGGCLACSFGLSLDVVECGVEQRPQLLALAGLRQDQETGVKLDPSVERDEICLIIGDEDSFFVND